MTRLQLSLTECDPAPHAEARSAIGNVSEAPVRILLVPGFVADTYSEIERSYVELCAQAPEGVEFVWLVPDISSKYNSFAKP